MSSGITPSAAARLAAALFVLCGALVGVGAVALPAAPATNRTGLLAVAVTAIAAGAVIWLLPWPRWPLRATLWLLPPAFALIGLHDYYAADSYRAAVFFFVSFAWIGLCHPQGTSLRFGPLAAAAYLGALAGHGHLSAVAAGSLAYALPGWVLTGEVVAWVATRLERAQSALAAREQSMRTLFAENPQPMWVYDRATLRFLEVNRAATDRYGYTRDEFLAMAIAEIGATHDATATERDDASPSSTSTDRRRSTSARHLVANGTRIEVEVTSHALQFDGHDAVVVTVQDVTERKRLEDRLRHQAFHDALTGLPNRALFNERVEDALTRRDSRADSIAVAMIDLDGFKTVNDSLGHTIGDEILVIVARRLHDTLGPGDLPVRLGGDEFVVVLEQRDGAGTFEERLERVVDALRAPFVLDGRSLELGASVGLATNQPGDGAEELLRNADMAMYVAKAAGKGCIRRFESEMHLAAVTRLELEADLRRAITANEFVVHYQPITLVPAQRTVGFEALVRWNHPRRGLLAPGDFVPLAEDTGLIVAIGRAVLVHACRQAREWNRSRGDDPLGVAVNLSAQQLRDPDLVTQVAAIAASNEIDPTRLTLEITESVLLDEPAGAIERLHELKSLGVRLAIDDFGTGYSSLGYLRTLPIDTVKIDKTFVDAIATDHESAGLVRAIVTLARTLGLQPVAEGVEDAAQLAALEALGCDLVQGFYFSPPVDAAAATRLVDATLITAQQIGA
ncbi:MAG TPA: EAL domain-containing protein [Acidimicrobiia bacterium]|nr:EAL domain-containing protein [Acidimicrobiia bacterium]